MKKIISLLFGQFTWIAPNWVNSLQKQLCTKPKFFLYILLGITSCLFALFVAYKWYQAQPHPEQIIAQITPPKLTPAAKVLVPESLNIDFGVVSKGGLSTRSVAPLNLINKTITKGITLTPNIPGKWYWSTDSHLTFTPTMDWPAGQTYTITFTKDFFNNHAAIADYSLSFKTLPFEIAISDFKFYQDPLNPQLRQAVATINFSYPLDTTSLDNKISLVSQNKATHYKYTLSYDQNKRTAYLHSEPLTLATAAQYIDLIIAKGLKPIAGPGISKQETKASILIPDIASYFKVAGINAAIIRNPNDRPEQVLSIETSLGVANTELNKTLHVYVLPKDYPATSLKPAQLDYAWETPGEITDTILKQSKPLNLHAIATDHDFSTLHSYQFQIIQPAYIYIKIDKGTKAVGDLTLTNDYVAVVKAPTYPQEISFLHKGALLALGSEEKLSVLVRGLSAVKFDYARVLPNDVNHLITQTGGDFNNPYFINYNFSAANISEIFSEVKKFDAKEPAQAQYSALDLGKYIAKNGNHNGPRGLFLLQARAWDIEHNLPLEAQANRLILITDLGLLAKDNSDGTHDFYVQSITKGEPVNNATVSILGKNGLALLTLPTDAQGHVNFPTLNDFINEKEPTVYLAKHGDDVSFMPYNRSDRLLNYSRFDIGGVTSSYENQAAISAFLFSERGIYRPGDLVHIGMMVKKPYALPEHEGLPLEVIITDARGVNVKDEKLTLNAEGFFALDYKTNTLAPTGQYVVSVYIIKDNHASNLIGSTTFNVAEFLPDRMRITTQLSQQANGWIFPSNLTATVTLKNLYGAAAENRRIAAKILLSPLPVSFSQFPDFIFVDPLLDPKSPPKIFTDTLLDAHTDENGQAQLDLKLDRFEKATYQLTVFTEGFEAEGGRSVTTQAKALVSPLHYFVGYKADGDLNYIKQNSLRHVNLIAINPELKQQELSNLKIQLFSQHPVTTLVKKEDGTYQYQSVLQTNLLSTTPFVIESKGSDYALKTADIGDFLVTIIDARGIELSKFKYNVVGNSQQPLPKNAELSVKLNKQEFQANDDIEIQVTAPYTGAGLITIERDKVYAQQWFKAATTTSLQKIRIPAGFQGNGYVNLAFVRDLNSSEIFINPLSYSIAPFSVSHQERELHIDLDLPQLARPGEKLIIKYKSDKPGKIILYAVDEGILQVSKYNTPNPLAYFFQKRALEVNTMQIVDQILPKYIADREISAVGGDNGEAALYKNLNPFKRKTEAPVVFWSGILDTDSSSKELTYQIPDYFNGSLKVMAVAAGIDTVGSTDKTIPVRGDFIINPNVPTFVAPGDEFEVTASIANNLLGSGNDAKITVELNVSPQLKMLDSSKQTITVAEGKEQSVHFRIKANSQLGGAELVFKASLNDKTAQLSSTLSVRPALPYVNSIISGYANSSVNKITLERVLYPEYRKVIALASPDPLILILGLAHYLEEYPYGCTEQLVSKALPLFAMLNQPMFAADTSTLTDKIQQIIQLLVERQMSNGAFNYWPQSGTPTSNDFATIYALHFLTDAREKNISVPIEVLATGVSYLKEFVTHNITTLEEARLQAYAIYILTRNEIVTTNYLTHLQLALNSHPNIKWKNDITSVYIASIYQLLKNQSEAEKMLAYFQPTITDQPDNDDFYNHNIANAEYLYCIAQHFPERLSKLNNTLIPQLIKAINNENISTVLSGYTSLAFNAYSAQMHAIPNNNSVITINEVDKNGHAVTVSSANQLYQQANITLQAKAVVYNNPSQQGYFYQLTQAGFDKKLPEKESAHNIEITREYKNKDDNALNNIHLGDELIVHIRIRSTDNQYYSNIAIVDLLPGGFEVMRDAVATTNSDYVDIREDRIIFFGSVQGESKEIIYRIKATNSGKFTLPPIFATSMYYPNITANSRTGQIVVN